MTTPIETYKATDDTMPHGAMYLSARKLARARAIARRRGVDVGALRSDDPGPGAFVCNILSRAAARGIRAAVASVIAAVTRRAQVPDPMGRIARE